MSSNASFYVGNLNSKYTNWLHANNSADRDCLATWPNSNNLVILYNPKDINASIPAAGTLALTQILLSAALALTVVSLTDVF